MATPTRKTTRRVESARSTRTQEYAAKAARGRSNPWVLGAIGIALFGILIVIALWATSGPSVEALVVQARKQIAEILSPMDKAAEDDALKLLADAVKVTQHENEEAAARLKSDRDRLQERIKEIEATRAQRKAVQTSVDDWGRRAKDALDAEPKLKLAEAKTRITEIKAAGVRLKADAETVGANAASMDELMAALDARLKNLPPPTWAEMRGRLNMAHDLGDREKARWGPAIAEARTVFVPRAEKAEADKAAEGIAHFETRARELLEAARARAERLSGAEGRKLLQDLVPRLKGSAVEKDLEELLR